MCDEHASLLLAYKNSIVLYILAVSQLKASRFSKGCWSDASDQLKFIEDARLQCFLAGADLEDHLLSHECGFSIF